MSNEVAINVSMTYTDSEHSEAALQTPEGLTVTVVTKSFVRHKQNVGTSEEALQFGEVAALGIIMLLNRDPTNFVNVRVSSGGTIIGKLRNGIPMFLPVGSGITAPYLQADSASCQVDVFVIST